MMLNRDRSPFQDTGSYRNRENSEVAEDPGFLLVQAGLVRDDQLLTAREAQAQGGGTLGEQLVLHDFVDDDDLTAFYASKLVIPRVTAEELARIPASVLRRIPADMAAEFRVIPVAADGERNVTLAMSDPADKHVVDEVAFFTGCYVVRAVATQLQIAWCLAHYYGVMTPLARARLVGADNVEVEEGRSNGSNGRQLFSATPWEVEEEEETGPARMPIMRRKVERRRTSELAPPQRDAGGPGPAARAGAATGRGGGRRGADRAERVLRHRRGHGGAPAGHRAADAGRAGGREWRDPAPRSAEDTSTVAMAATRSGTWRPRMGRLSRPGESGY